MIKLSSVNAEKGDNALYNNCALFYRIRRSNFYKTVKTVLQKI